ncbi:RNA polymerase sigma factor [Zavarzinella formosa]|uniref:RNA polymerase sigma factor n=1 Tax=Zavarzinella formosa TaxID=360055 RepID=UPI00030647FC|nr:RNA polymerase sigma factor [Zavarzinella formosa]
MTDAELVAASLNGSVDAYAQLARRWGHRIAAICHSKVRRADVADDLTQETLFRGYRSLNTLTDRDRFGTWLMGIAVRASLDWLKASERKTVVFTALSPDKNVDGVSRSDHVAELEHRDECRRLMREVECLPEDLRQALMLYYYEDMTYRQLGELLGISAATVNARLTKARLILRERLSPSMLEPELTTE